MLYATDASIYQQEPIGVVLPASAEDAMRAVRFCLGRGLAILPRGGGTSLAGQCTNRAVVIDFTRGCDRLTCVDAAARRCRVEAGCAVDDLNERLREHGLFFAPDPATSRQASIGGCIGNNAAGARSIKYGRTSENVGAVRACLADGRVVEFSRGSGARDPDQRNLTLQVAGIVTRHERLIRERFPKTIRRNAGYALDMVLAQIDSAGPRADADDILASINLAHLLCGSEGTLAASLDAELILHPVPIARGLSVLGFSSLEAAIDAVRPILALNPSAVELLDDVVLSLAGSNLEYRRYVDLMPRVDGAPPTAVLYVEFEAMHDASELAHGHERLVGLVPHASSARFSDAAAIMQAWKLRKAGEPLLHGVPGNRKPYTFVEDNAVPVENLAEFVRRFKQICAHHGTHAAYWAHASVGVLHIRPFLDLRDPADERHMHEIAVEAADLARELGGVMSGEHGDGKVRGPLLERYFGPELMGAFREVKRVFDPRNLLNPGNIVEPGPIESISKGTRIKPDARQTRLLPVRTYYEFADQHGLLHAAEMCNGSGVCRKRSGGVMCPSYKATLDERHSTRGRGNALRLAVTGQLSGAAREGATGPWRDPEVLSTLDLCLSCKACKAECPSNVDIARLKSEYLAQAMRSRGGMDIKSALTAHVRAINRLGAITPALSNALARSAIGKLGARLLMGVHPKRSLPPFARPDRAGMTRIRSGRDLDLLDKGARHVAIFADCFSMYNEPGIIRAAASVARKLGCTPVLIEAGCCGRPAISVVALDTAVAMADRALPLLDAAASASHVAGIVFLEPSCLSAVKDDWLDLKLATERPARERVASKSYLAEQFVDLAWDDHPRKPDIGEPERGAVLHAHCHQKALWGADSSARALRRVFGDRLRVPDTGCCGMAGSFGFAAHRYDLSMKIGELTVFPEARGATSQGDLVIAPGASCRHQLLDALNLHATHPIEALDRHFS